VRIEAIQTLSKLVDERRAEAVRAELQAQVSSPDQTVARMAAAAISELENRLAGLTPTGGSAPTSVVSPTSVRPPQPTTIPPPLAPAEVAKTMLISDQAVSQ